MPRLISLLSSTLVPHLRAAFVNSITSTRYRFRCQICFPVNRLFSFATRVRYLRIPAQQSRWLFLSASSKRPNVSWRNRTHPSFWPSFHFHTLAVIWILANSESQSSVFLELAPSLTRITCVISMSRSTAQPSHPTKVPNSRAALTRFNGFFLTQAHRRYLQTRTLPP